MKTFRGLFLLLVSSFAFGQTAADKITAGRAALAAHDLATAQIRFQEALAINPTAEAAGALLGVTRCFTIVNWTSSYNFLNRLGVSSAGRNVYHWKATLSRDANGRVILPDTLNFTEASDYWLTTLIPESERARASLALVTNAGFLISFTTTETGLPTTTNIDYGDVLMMRASLRAAEFVGHAFSGQDLHLNIGSAWQLQQGDLLTLQRVLADNPDFLKPGAFAERTAARTALLETIALYRQASEIIRARPAGLNRLFVIAPGELAKEADFRKWLDKAERSLNSFVNVAKDGSSDQWGYLGALATADFSFRGLLPPIASDGTFDPEAIPDPSLGGAMVGVTRAKVVSRLTEAGLKPDLGVEWMNPKPQGNALNGYAYGAGTHVAVGAGGTLRTSVNGIDWTVKKLPTDANLQAVAYGAGRFVAVGHYTMWQSTDGQTWHEVKNAGGAFTVILYAGGRFVAMGGGAAVTSVDGLTWQFGYYGFGEAYRALVYFGTQYVAAGSGGALAGRILTSPDGLTWTTRLVTTTGRLRGIASNGSRLVALGENNVLANSTDGVNWTEGTMMTVTGTPPDYFAVASKDGRFVATGGQSTTSGQQSVVATSTDGLTWTTVASGEQGNLYKAFAGPDAVYGFAWSGAMVRATDGSTFVRVGGYQNTALLPTTLLELRDLGGKLYALGTGGVMMTSTDGLAFAAVSTGVTADLWSVVRQGNVWLAVGNGGTVLKSADGLAWTPLAIGTAANLRTVAYLNGLYLVAGGAGTLFTSTDGTTWTQRATGLAATGTTIYGLAYGNGTYMAVGGETAYSRVVLTSTDGVTWAQRAVGEYPSFRVVVFQDGAFTALGNSYGIYRSANGIAWNYAVAAGGGFQSALRSVGGRYHAFSSPVDGAGETSPTEVRISADGAEWYKVTLPVVGAIYAAERFQGRTYLAGASGAILRTRPVAPSSSPTVRVLTAGRQLKQGDTFALAVSALGDGQLSYQWKKDGNIIVGATTAALELGNVQTSTAGSYTVTVTNGAGSAPSAAMVITVDGTPVAPVIVGQPQGQTVNVGLNATLAVNAAGTAPFTYQWKKDSVNVSGGTAATLVLTGVQAAQAGSYTVVVTNTAGSATSLPAVLVVDPNVGYTFTTMAGMAGVSGAADGTGAAARFNYLSGVAVDSAGNVFVADRNNYAIRKVTPAGVVTTVAGGNPGNLDGIGTAARFNSPAAVALDAAGANLYVADFGNLAVRKIVMATGEVSTLASGLASPNAIVIDGGNNAYVTTGNTTVSKITPSGTVSVFAGDPGIRGWIDGVGSAARFSSLQGIARDATGNLFVTDMYNFVVRKIAPDATVTTVAGRPGVNGITDGPLSIATLYYPMGIAVDSAGSIYVSEMYAQTVRKISAGFVRTIGGSVGSVGSSDGVGAAARFYWPSGLAVDGSGNLFVADQINQTVRKGMPSASPQSPVIGAMSPDQTVVAGSSVTLSITVAGVAPFTYQWFKDGSPVANGTGDSLSFTNVSTSQAGTYSLSVANAYGSVMTKVATLVVNATPSGSNGLVNGSVRANTGIGAATLTGVFAVEGAAAKRMLVRALGPTLATFGVTGMLADPRMEIVDASTGAPIAFNEDWGLAGNAADVPAVTARVGAFPLTVGAKDAVVLANFAPGTYRVRVGGAGGTTGIVLLEIYDADTPPRLVYLATRGQAGMGNDALIQGFVVNTLATGRSYLIRALGPSLGVPGAHPDPQLSVLTANGGTVLASNDNWGGSSVLSNLALAAGAMPLPATSKDAAVNFVPASADAYTVMVSGTGGATGVALLEIFEVDAQRAGAIPPAVVSNPENLTVGAGQPATFGVVTTGKPPPSYQWRRDGGAIIGATNSNYTVLAAQAADAGLYDVVVSNQSGGIVSGSASLTVGAATGSFATHAVVGPGYVPGGAVTISGTLGYVGTPGSLAWSVVLPAGWSYVSGAGDLGAVTPRVGDVGTLGWAWTSLPPSPVRFTYTVNVPAGENVARPITASAIIRPQGDPVQTIVAAPASLLVERVVAHSADSDQDYHIGLFELTRVIELYNTRNGSVRTGCYAVAASVTEDGFTPDPSRAATAIVVNGRVHSADSDRDGRLTLVELTRVIELYNTRSGTTRTGQYHVQAGTEDGFAPGP